MRHSRHQRQLEATPRLATTERASDADRESAVAELRDHGAVGRLDVEELEQRIGAAYAARTRGDLAALLADLPDERTVVAAPRHRHRHRGWHGHEWNGFLAVNALLVAIWAVSGAGHFWPGWVMAWWALALLMKSAPRLVRPR